MKSLRLTAMLCAVLFLGMTGCEPKAAESEPDSSAETTIAGAAVTPLPAVTTFTAQTMDGGTFTSEDLAAADITVINIWQTTCPPCISEMPELARLEKALPDNVRFVTANAFDLLKEKQSAGEKYDVVILDPPAFTKTRGAVEGALRGYKEINLRAMKLLRDGGYLVTCSCSQHVLPPMFQKMVQDAAADTHCRLMQVEFRTQGRDHPILPALPETQYLKCGIYRVEK